MKKWGFVERENEKAKGETPVSRRRLTCSSLGVL